MAIWPFGQKSGVDTAQRTRLALSSLWTPSRDNPLKVTTGFVDDGGAVASVNAGTMDVLVTSFKAIVQPSSATQGAYPVVLDATGTVTLPNGGGADVAYTIAAIVEDSTFDASGQQRARVFAYTGAAPAGTVIPIRAFNLRAGVSTGTGGLQPSDLGADLRKYTVAHGGIRRVASTDRPATPFLGQTIYESDTLNTMQWDGSGWRHILRRPQGKWRQSNIQSIPSVTDTVIDLNVQDINIGGMTDLANNRVLIPRDGSWWVYGRVAYEPDATAGSYRRCGIRKNGTTVVTMGVPLDPNVATGLVTVPHVSDLLVLAAGDYLELMALHTKPTPLNTAVGTYNSYILAVWMGPSA